MKREIGVLACALALPGVTVALAQDVCPATATCYEGHQLIFDAADGPVQFLVVSSTARIVTTLDDQTTTETVTLVEFVSTGDGYEQRGDALVAYPKTGVLKTAQVGDTFGLIEIGGE